MESEFRVNHRAFSECLARKKNSGTNFYCICHNVGQITLKLAENYLTNQHQEANISNNIRHQPIQWLKASLQKKSKAHKPGQEGSLKKETFYYISLQTYTELFDFIKCNILYRIIFISFWIFGYRTIEFHGGNRGKLSWEIVSIYASPNTPMTWYHKDPCNHFLWVLERLVSRQVL